MKRQDRKVGEVRSEAGEVLYTISAGVGDPIASGTEAERLAVNMGLYCKYEDPKTDDLAEEIGRFARRLSDAEWTALGRLVARKGLLREHVSATKLLRSKGLLDGNGLTELGRAVAKRGAM